jgi:hypothetical protein
MSFLFGFPGASNNNPSSSDNDTNTQPSESSEQENNTTDTNTDTNTTNTDQTAQTTSNTSTAPVPPSFTFASADKTWNTPVTFGAFSSPDASSANSNVFGNATPTFGSTVFGQPNNTTGIFGTKTTTSAKAPSTPTFGTSGFTFGGTNTLAPSFGFSFGGSTPSPLTSSAVPATTTQATSSTTATKDINSLQETFANVSLSGSSAPAEKVDNKLFTFNTPQKDELKQDTASCSTNGMLESYSNINFFVEIASLFGDHVTGDIYLKSNNNNIPVIAHRTILAANSTTFKNIFYGDDENQPQKYKNKDILELNDVDFITLQALLRHMYTLTLKLSAFPYIAQELMNIFDAAAKYELWDLADQCVIVLATSTEGSNRVTASNVCQVWIWAHERSQRTTILIETCVRIFISESRAVLTAEGFLDWSEEVSLMLSPILTI